MLTQTPPLPYSHHHHHLIPSSSCHSLSLSHSPSPPPCHHPIPLLSLPPSSPHPCLHPCLSSKPSSSHPFSFLNSSFPSSFLFLFSYLSPQRELSSLSLPIFLPILPFKGRFPPLLLPTVSFPFPIPPLKASLTYLSLPSLPQSSPRRLSHQCSNPSSLLCSLLSPPPFIHLPLPLGSLSLLNHLFPHPLRLAHSFS